MKKILIVIIGILIVVFISGCTNSIKSFNNQYISFDYPNDMYVEDAQDNSTGSILTGRESDTGKGGYDLITFTIAIMPASDILPANLDVWQMDWIKQGNEAGYPPIKSGYTKIDGIKTAYVFDNLSYAYYLVKNDLTYSIEFYRESFSENEVQDIIKTIKIK